MFPESTTILKANPKQILKKNIKVKNKIPYVTYANFLLFWPLLHNFYDHLFFISLNLHQKLMHNHLELKIIFKARNHMSVFLSIF